ncbi:MAG: hypothetical protein H6702_09710 [Myxococcales bacterium]|nr:hypothetical protein [Myxococcales bacterium]
MRRALLLALALAAGACNRGGTDEAYSPPPAPPPPPAPAALQPLFPQGPVRLPAPFQGVEPGMRWADAVARAPALAREGALVDPAWPGLRFTADRAGDQVARVSVELPLGADAPLAAAWGAPTAGEDALGRVVDLWWAPDVGLRATLTAPFAGRRNLVFERYLPAAEALARLNGRFGFEAQLSLLGADAASVAAAFGAAWTAPEGPLLLPPTEHGAGPTVITVEWAGGRIASFTAVLDHERDARTHPALFQALARGRGAPTVSGGVHRWAGAGREITAVRDPATRSVTLAIRAADGGLAHSPTKAP